MAKKAPFAVDQVVRFKGYSDEVPEDQQLLTEGETYTVAEVNAADSSVAISIDNPDFNPKKKESEENAKTILVDVFFDEIEAADDEEAEEAAPAPKAKAKPAAKGKAKAEADEDNTDDDGDDEAPAPKAKAKPAAKGKVAEKPAAKGKAKAEPKGKLAKKAEPKAEEEDKYGALDSEDEDILELVNESDNLCELASELVEDSAALDYKLGGVLYHVRLAKAHHKVDKKYKENGGFMLYVQEQLNIDYRKAMYLIDIYFKFNKFGIDAAKVQELGWTKCSKIAAVMTEDNAEDLVELAEESSVADLVSTIKETYVSADGKKSDGEKRRKVTIKVRLWDDQATAVTEVLATAQSELGLKTLDDTFEHIVMEWATEHGIGVSKAKASAKAAKGKAKAEADEDEDEAEPAPARKTAPAKGKATAKARA